MESKHGVHRGEDCMKRFCESLREHATEIINFEKNNVIPLTNAECISYHNQWHCHIFYEKFEEDANDKKHRWGRDH